MTVRPTGAPLPGVRQTRSLPARETLSQISAATPSNRRRLPGSKGREPLAPALFEEHMARVEVDVEVRRVRFMVDVDRIREALRLHSEGNYSAAAVHIQDDVSFDWERAPQGPEYWERVHQDLTGEETTGNWDSSICYENPRPDAMAILAGWIGEEGYQYLPLSGGSAAGVRL